MGVKILIQNDIVKKHKCKFATLMDIRKQSRWCNNQKEHWSFLEGNGVWDAENRSKLGNRVAKEHFRQGAGCTEGLLIGFEFILMNSMNG